MEDNSSVLEGFLSSVDAPQLPNVATMYADMTRPSINRVQDIITKPVVEKVVIPEGDGLTPMNYVFDLRGIDEWTAYEKASLKALTKRIGDTGLYIITKGAGLRKFGMGIGKEIAGTAVAIKDVIFKGNIRIYKDVNTSSEIREVSTIENIDLRLNL